MNLIILMAFETSFASSCALQCHKNQFTPNLFLAIFDQSLHSILGPEILTAGDLNAATGVPPGGGLQHQQQSDVFAKIGGSLKTLASDTIKSTAGNAAAFASQVKAQMGSKNSDASTPSIPAFVPR